MYEASERVALIVAGPGVPAGRVVRGLATLLDVLPTLVDLAGADPTLPGHAPSGGLEGRG